MNADVFSLLVLGWAAIGLSRQNLNFAKRA